MPNYPNFNVASYPCTKAEHHELVNKMAGSRVSTVCRFCGASWATLDQRIREEAQ
jgi:hypothetical protein